LLAIKIRAGMSATMSKSGLEACALVSLTVRGDDRGSLIALEGRSAEVPFDIARIYYVFATAPGIDRGFHAHHALNQIAIAIAGSCTMYFDDGQRKRAVRLDRPNVAVTIPPMVWHDMHDFSANCILLVLADAKYDEADYIRDYETFVRLAGQ
jgi:dTDP-4-dehydrorhamnose 3,5-epimerase-like enzyme